MKALLYGKYGEYPAGLEKDVAEAGVEIVKENPELIITFGGDGTLLGAERDYPGVPKLPLRDSKFCHVCAPMPNAEILKLLARGEMRLTEFSKVEAAVGDRKLTALNDIILRNKLPNSALRFKVAVRSGGKEEAFDNLTGDGLIVATPFGATGYYQSITKQTFSGGFGLAFNNLHTIEKEGPIYIMLEEIFELKITIGRGPAVLAADNDPEMAEPAEGTEIAVRKSTDKGRIYLV